MVVRKRHITDARPGEPKDDKKLPKGYLSFSAVEMYLKCGQQFKFRYVDGIKSPPSVAMVEGSSHHSWLQTNNNLQKEKKKIIGPEDAMDIFVEAWKKHSKDVEKRERLQSENEVLTRAPRLIGAYIKRLAPKMRPIDVEKRFRILMGGVPFVGFIDLVDKNKGALDYKTTSKKKTSNQVKNSLQLGSYARVLGTNDVGFVSLVKTKSPTVELVTTKLASKDVQWADDIAASTADAIKRGAFPKTSPDNWWCSEKFCGYWHQCRGAKPVLRKPGSK